MQVIGRKQALESGLKHFFTGEPCTNGHQSPRHVRDGSCLECRRERRAMQRAADLEADRARGRLYDAKRRETETFKERKKAYRSKPEVLAMERERSRQRKSWLTERERKWRRLYQKSETYRAFKRRYVMERIESDPQFALMHKLRARVRVFLRRSGSAKSGSVSELIGCDAPALRAHIESQFLPDMTWDNWSVSGWHVDHIRPLSSFDLTDPMQLAAACHYTNLRPMWAVDNIKKGAKITDGVLRANIRGGGR